MSLFRKKTAKPPKQPPLDPGFRKPEGQHYLDFLERLHTRLEPKWYLEIGTQSGASLAKARCRSIAIDPDFQITVDAFRHAPQIHMFRATSDDFFATDFLVRNDVRLDLAFLDGLHLFEYLLRDLINSEKAAAPGAVFALHDCVPLNHLMAERDWDRTRTLQWTGDVWKLLPILQRYRPDLKVRVIDCAPTGLVLVSNLDPDSRVLAGAYDAILAEVTGLSIADYGLARFAAEFPFVAANDAALSP